MSAAPTTAPAETHFKISAAPNPPPQANEGLLPQRRFMPISCPQGPTAAGVNLLPQREHTVTDRPDMAWQIIRADDGLPFCIWCNQPATANHINSPEHQAQAAVRVPQTMPGLMPGPDIASGPQQIAIPQPVHVASDMWGPRTQWVLDQPWCQPVEWWWWCALCSKGITDTHLNSENHKKRVAHDEHKRAVKAPLQSGQLQLPSTTPTRFASPFDPELLQKPYIELRDEYPFCKACEKWAVPDHVAAADHIRRIGIHYPEQNPYAICPFVPGQGPPSATPYCAPLWPGTERLAQEPWIRPEVDDGNTCLVCNSLCQHEMQAAFSTGESAHPPPPPPPPPPAPVQAQFHQVQEFIVDNTVLKTTTRGLQYRWTKNLNDRITDERGNQAHLAFWSTTVRGNLDGDGWLEVLTKAYGTIYLPSRINGYSVLKAASPNMPAKSPPPLAHQASVSPKGPPPIPGYTTPSPFGAMPSQSAQQAGVTPKGPPPSMPGSSTPLDATPSQSAQQASVSPKGPPSMPGSSTPLDATATTETCPV